MRLRATPARTRTWTDRLAARVFPATDLAFDDEEGRRVAVLRLHVARPNELLLGTSGERVVLTRRGLLVPRFEAVTSEGTLARLEYDLLSGDFDLTLADGTRRRIERAGLLLPEWRIRDAEGALAVAIESLRVRGKEALVTLHPREGSLPERDLLALAALVLHARASLSLLYSAAVGAGALAPTRVPGAGRS